MANLYVGEGKTYTTIQAAVAAASHGDTIFIWPGTYEAQITLDDKLLNFVGVTDSPENDDILWRSADGVPVTGNCIYANYSPTITTPWYIEGITFYHNQTTSWRNLFVGDSAGTDLYLNRCSFKNSAGDQYCINLNDTAFNKIIITNCLINRGYSHVFNANWTAAVDAVFDKCQLNNTYYCYSCSGSPAIFDYVTTATESYGPAYGTFYNTPWTGYADGYVMEKNIAVQRKLYFYHRDTGELQDTATSAADGYYYLETQASGTHNIVCLDDESGDTYNDLIISRVTPTTVSG